MWGRWEQLHTPANLHNKWINISGEKKTSLSKVRERLAETTLPTMRGGRGRRYHGDLSRPYNCEDDRCLDYICLEVFSPATKFQKWRINPPT